MQSYHITFLCGSRSTIFMPMSQSHTHTYSVFMLTTACRQCLLHLMRHQCSLQTCCLQLSPLYSYTVAHHHLEHTHAQRIHELHLLEITFEGRLAYGAKITTNLVYDLLHKLLSYLHRDMLSISPSLKEVFQRVFLLHDQVIEIHLYLLIFVLHLSIIVLVLKLIQQVSGQPVLLTSPAFYLG